MLHPSSFYVTQNLFFLSPLLSSAVSASKIFSFFFLSSFGQSIPYDIFLFIKFLFTPCPISLNFPIPFAILLSGMGRVKLKIKRLESISNRQVTYSKRKTGIIKKAKELSILCDIDIILLMFSPSGKPTIFHGERSNVEEILAKFAQLTPQERAKRKVESLEVLKRTFKKLDHDVNVQDFLGTSTQTVEDLTDQLRMLQAQLSDAQRRLRNWSNIDEIDNVEVLGQMENLITDSLNNVRGHKEKLEKHQLLLLDCTRQNAISLPIMMEGFQEALSFPWLPNNDSQSIMFTNGPNFLHQRDLEYSNDAVVPGYSGYLGSGKQADISNFGQVDNMGPESSAFNGACLNLPIHEQYSYAPYNILNLHENKELKTDIGISPQESCVDYQASTSLELPRPIYDTGYHAWAPITGPCDIAVNDGDSDSQQPNRNDEPNFCP